MVSCSEIIFSAKNFEEAFCRQSDTLAKVPEEGKGENGHIILCSFITNICLVLADLIFVKKYSRTALFEENIARIANAVQCHS